MSSNKYAVIGLGQFGSAIARKLASKGAIVQAIDNNEHHIESIKDDVAYAVMLDATDKKALLSQNIQDSEAVVVAIGKNFEALLLCTAYLIELNVKRIIARANSQQQRMILEKIGITEILSPEDEVAKVVSERLINPSIVSFLEFPDNYEIVEIKAPKGIINRTLREISLRNNYHLNLVTIKREYEEKRGDEIVKAQHILGVPGSDTIIYESDTIVVFGTIKDINRFIEIN